MQVHADSVASSTPCLFEAATIGGSAFREPLHWPAELARALEAWPSLGEILRLAAYLHGRSPLPRPSDRLAVAAHFEVAGSNEARTRQLIGRKMNQIWALTDGWRGPGTMAPTRVARDFYLLVVQGLPGHLLAAAQPTPTVDGGIHMEWTRGDRDFAAEITGDGELILTVLAPDDAHDFEQDITKPRTEDLADFIRNGV
jgi:hypothetical protein